MRDNKFIVSKHANDVWCMDSFSFVLEQKSNKEAKLPTNANRFNSKFSQNVFSCQCAQFACCLAKKKKEEKWNINVDFSKNNVDTLALLLD